MKTHYSGVGTTQWDFSDSMNRNKRRGDAFERRLNPAQLFSCVIMIGCKEVARWLSEAQGVSEVEARLMTATLEIEK